MKSLADRHADRAARIAANATEITGITAGSVGTAATLYRQFRESTLRLSKEEEEQLKQQVDNIEEELGGYLSLAEAPDGSGRTMAGIGVVNTKVVPSALDIPEAGNGGGEQTGSDGWGASAQPSAQVATDPNGPNLNGQALEDQGAATPAPAKATKAADKA